MKMTAEEMITMMQSVEGRTPLQPMRLDLKPSAARRRRSQRTALGKPADPGDDGDGGSEPPGQSRTTRSATPRAPPPAGAIDAACPQSDRRYRQ